MSHTKSKFADPAVNFSQILPIRWFCEVFYQTNKDTKNDVRMYRCFPVINTLLRLWLILLTSFLYPCPFIGALVGKGREGLQTIICFWKNARKRLFQHLSQEKRKSNSVFTFFFFFFLNLLVFYQMPSLEKLQSCWKEISYVLAGKRTNPRLEKLGKSKYPDQDQLNFQRWVIPGRVSKFSVAGKVEFPSRI